MKVTPSNCKLVKCKFNLISPPENSQECICCPHLKDEKWQPKLQKKRKL